MCAVSPWAIVAVILMLASDRPSNAYAWLAGWCLSTFGIGALMILLLGNDDFSNASSTPSTAACVIQVILGVLLLLLARRFWGKRPSRTGKRPEQPKWMLRIGQMKARWAFLIGAFWINTALVVAAGLDTLRSGIPKQQALVAFAIFTLITASVQAAMIIYSVVARRRAAVGLGRIREWIARNQEVALAVIFLALAVWLASKGIRGLGA